VLHRRAAHRDWRWPRKPCGACSWIMGAIRRVRSAEAVPVEDLLTLEGALSRLEAVDPRGAEVVTLRFFSGLSVPEVAEHLGVSVSTIEGKWAHARAWLRRDLGQGS
jgi:DNA-directed RNA polymerase specialized sigma24 family protein